MILALRGRDQILEQMVNEFQSQQDTSPHSIKCKVIEEGIVSPEKVTTGSKIFLEVERALWLISSAF